MNFLFVKATQSIYVRKFFEILEKIILDIWIDAQNI